MFTEHVARQTNRLYVLCMIVKLAYYLVTYSLRHYIGFQFNEMILDGKVFFLPNNTSVLPKLV